MKPVQKNWSPMSYYWTWLLGSLLLVLMAMLSIQNFRPGFLGQLGQWQFLLETIFGFSPAFLFGLYVVHKSVPGIEVSNKWLVLSGFCFLLFIGFLLYGLWGSFPSLAPSMAGKRPFCFYEILAFSWGPIGLLSYVVKKGYVNYSMKLGMMVGLAGASLPMAFMQVACMYVPEHIITHHLYGAILSSAAAGVVGFLVLKPKY